MSFITQLVAIGIVTIILVIVLVFSSIAFNTLVYYKNHARKQLRILEQSLNELYRQVVDYAGILKQVGYDSHKLTKLIDANNKCLQAKTLFDKGGAYVQLKEELDELVRTTSGKKIEQLRVTLEQVQTQISTYNTHAQSYNAYRQTLFGSLVAKCFSFTNQDHFG
jgi:hypothetical protein